MKEKAYGICLFKKNNSKVKILLCKAIDSKNKWGCLKGGTQKGETQKETAIREFYEESGIYVKQNLLGKYFKQTNSTKDIGIYLVNYKDIKGVDKYFYEDKLITKYLSWENSKAEFFDINSLPLIKKKQEYLLKDIVKYFQSR